MDIIQERLDPQDTMILLAYRGSMAHGMYVPNSDPNSIDDIDLMGVIVPSAHTLHGLHEWGKSETMEIKKDEWDIVLYSVQKTLNLLGRGNPNILSLVWVDDQHVLSETEAGRLLRSHRDIFMSLDIYPAFQGYAYSQLHKMTNNAFEGYMGAKRKRLVEQYGYDCKNAAHLIRLLKMGIEAVNTGTMQVDRSNLDAEELLSIKRGEWSLEKIKSHAELLFGVMEESKRQSKLPTHPDWDEIDRLCIELTEMTLETQN